MKQITVVSGKGGTGKTTLTAALAGLAESKVLADCDVDAANLYLILKSEIKEQHEFKASKLAAIDKNKCTACGQCLEVCRFEAIADDYVIDPVSCEGCGLCFRICPAGAIEFTERVSGRYFISGTRFGTLVHARLGVAEENSGKLVSLVRKQARELAKKQGVDHILIDGPPGISCPVIASLTGVDLALIVTEPTLSGIHDLERVIDLADHFRIKSLVCVNKHDINPDNVRAIENICAKRSVEIAGRLPYDPKVNEAVRRCETVIEHDPASLFSLETKRMWQVMIKKLGSLTL